jgi:hypothetical protein
MKCPSCIRELWTEDALADHWETFHQASEGDLVEECFGCPECGERRVSHLEFVPPYMDEVKCQTCCYVYEP